MVAEITSKFRDSEILFPFREISREIWMALTEIVRRLQIVDKAAASSASNTLTLSTGFGQSPEFGSEWKCPDPSCKKTTFDIEGDLYICECGATRPKDQELLAGAEDIEIASYSDGGMRIYNNSADTSTVQKTAAYKQIQSMNQSAVNARKLTPEIMNNAAELFHYLQVVTMRGDVRAGTLSVCVYKVMDAKGIHVKPTEVQVSLNITPKVFSQGEATLNRAVESGLLPEEAYTSGLIKRTENIRVTRTSHFMDSLDRTLARLDMESKCVKAGIKYENVVAFCRRCLEFCQDFSIVPNSKPINTPPGVISVLCHQIDGLKISRQDISNASTTSKSTFGRVKNMLQAILDNPEHRLYSRLVHICHKFEVVPRGQPPKPSRNSKAKTPKVMPEVTIRSLSDYHKDELPMRTAPDIPDFGDGIDVDVLEPL